MAQFVTKQTEGQEGETEGDFSNEHECEGEGINISIDSEEFKKVKEILSRHDEENRITMQVVSNLEQDGITLELLCEFDDQSLIGVIDSWALNTFDKKYFLIRGILINGIKKLNARKPKPQADIPNAPEEQTGIDGKPIAKIDEKRQIKLLNKWLKTINKQLETYENESKMADTAKNDLLTQYVNEIQERFDKLEKEALNEIKQRRHNAINVIEENFRKIGREEEEYYKRLKSLKTQIGRLGLSQNENIIKMRGEIVKKCQNNVFSNVKLHFNNDLYSHVIGPIPKKWNEKLVNIIDQYCIVTRKSKKQRKKDQEKKKQTEAKELAKQKKKEKQKQKQKEKKKAKKKEKEKAKQEQKDREKVKQEKEKETDKNNKGTNDKVDGWAESEISLESLSRDELSTLIDHRSKMTIYLEVYNKRDLLKLLRSGYSLQNIKSQESDFAKMNIDGLKLELRLRDKEIINDAAYKDGNKNVLIEKLKQFVAR